MSASPFIAGRGEAIASQRGRFDAPALGAIRYADPASWITATAVADAVAPVREAVMAAHDRVAVVVTSAEGPVEAMAAMCEAARAGSSSPIRFPASNAGSLAGLTSIAFGFRGPTLMLTLPADRGVPVGLLLAEAWLGRRIASYVVLAWCGRRGASDGGGPIARCLLLAAAEPAPPNPLDRARDAAWLIGGSSAEAR
jgi:hypothetical protein